MNTVKSERQSISLAKTVASVVNLSNPYAKSIMNRDAIIDKEFVNAIINQSVFSWEGRSPKSALDKNGNFQTTDLDLLSFMIPLVARGGVIEIPKYTNRRKTVKKSNERRIGTSRFGKTTGLISNKDVFSFSVRLFDQSVIVKDTETETESTGAHRNLLIVDCDGHWYDGWDKIVWDPTKKENAFLNDNDLWTGNTVCFKHYVHPNRRQSIFGAPYLLLKMLSARLTDEAKFYRQEVKRLQKLGIKFPKGEKSPFVPVTYESSTEPINVATMEMILDMPEFSGEYSAVSNDVFGLVEAYRKQKYLTYTLKPLVQFVLRADEAAYFLYGHSQ